MPSASLSTAWSSGTLEGGGAGPSEDIGQRLPLAGGLGHHLLQVQSLAQLLRALLLGDGRSLQGSCRADRAGRSEASSTELR